MSRVDWNDQLDEDMHFATNMLLDHGQITPMFVLHPREGDTLIIGGGFANDEEKMAVYMYIQWMCIAHDVVGFSFIGEAWLRLLTPLANETPSETNERAFRVRPSEAPDRKEVVTVTLVFRDEGKKKVISKMAEIVRDAAGTAVRVVPILLPPGSSAEGGELVRILLDKTPPASVRADAALLLSRVPEHVVQRWNLRSSA